MKFLPLLLTIVLLTSCDPKDLEKILGNAGGAVLSNADIAAGLKEALDKGVDQSVRTLSVTDGFYKSAYKILLPDEARKIIDKLKFIPGFSNLEEEVVKRLNKGAEDAASKAGPIFIGAIKEMTFDDVMNVLMGDKNAATQYLNRKTYNALYGEFKPVIVTSLNKFGALEYWADAVNTYNSLPFVDRVNPDLADHVTTKALSGMFDLIEKKELGIRTDISQRTTDLLKKVFARQDSK